MGKEASSWDWLRDGIIKALPAYSLLERVENGVVVGMADVNYVIRGSEGWIELKANDCPKKPGTPVLGEEKGLNLEQRNWHIARQRMNSKTWVFISAKPYRWLISGIHAREINSMTVEQLNEKSRVATSKNWSEGDWTRLLRALTGG